MGAPLPAALEAAIRAFNAHAATFNDDPLAVDRAIAELWSEPHSACIGPLLLALDDKSDHPEVMFSLIHAAESFPDEEYVAGLVATLVELAVRAPEWTQILLVRVLNSHECGEQLIRQTSSASMQVKDAIAVALADGEGTKPGFAERKARLLLAAS